MLRLKQVHHIVIIATGYAANRAFYCDVLGSTLISKAYREERDLWEDDLALSGQYVIELFPFPFPPCRPSRPEAYGLRHLVFGAKGVEKPIAHLEAYHVKYKSIRIGPFTGKHFALFNDPDGSPLELHEL